VASCGNSWWVLTAPGCGGWAAARTRERQGRQAHRQAENTQGAGFSLRLLNFERLAPHPQGHAFLIYLAVGSFVRLQHGAPLLALQNEEAQPSQIVLTWKSHHDYFSAPFLNDPGL